MCSIKAVGEEAREQLTHFDRDVLAESPALVIWQVGTNAIMHNYDLDDFTAAIQQGLDRLAGLAMDVVLMDPQYVPALLAG
jgi:hypothetical protein